jgi:hypothetical protein
MAKSIHLTRLLPPAFALFALWAVQAQQPAPTPVLGTAAAQFTVGGTPRFLLFVSYFDAMRAGDLDGDFTYIRRAGFDGIRIFPNWYHYVAGAPADDDGLFTREGTIRAERWRVFIRVLERAAAHGLVVDVSFTRDTITGLSHERYGDQLRAATAALRGRHPHVLFDLQNEFPIHMKQQEMEALLRTYVRPADPDRIVTASLDSGSTPDPAQAGRIAAALALPVLAYHEARDRERWYTEAQAKRIVGALQAGLGDSRVPIYLQEPIAVATLCPPRCAPGDWDSGRFRARDAARAAKQAGAAAWTFHTRSTFDLASISFVERLQADPAQKAAFDAFQDFER